MSRTGVQPGVEILRDLPIRLAEFGSCHRNEPSGSLHGIMRVRGFTQDDAHIFCTKEQIGTEVADFIKLTLDVYKDFGFEDVQMKLSTRPENVSVMTHFGTWRKNLGRCFRCCRS